MRLTYLLLPIINSIFTFINAQSFQADCRVQYGQMDKQEPLLATFSNRFDLVEPLFEELHVPIYSSILLICQGSKRNEVSIKSAVCVDSSFKIIDGNRQFGCEKSVFAEIKNLGPSGLNNVATLHDIGYNINRYGWFGIISICYNQISFEVIYTHHKLYGSSIAYANRDNTRRSFRRSGLPDAIDRAYGIKRELNRFQELGFFNASSYINNHSFLAKGHMSPDRDFVFRTSQIASYFLMNVSPQWQVINNGNWRLLENSVRAMASRTKRTLHVFTGGYKTLKLNNGKMDVGIYLLKPDKVPVPMVHWKILYCPDSLEAIAFVTVNNPFYNIHTEEYNLCPDICDIYGWNKKEYKNKSRGYTYCCDVRYLKSLITIPYFHINGILYA